jgi:hypothetical protein
MRLVVRAPSDRILAIKEHQVPTKLLGCLLMVLQDVNSDGGGEWPTIAASASASHAIRGRKGSTIFAMRGARKHANAITALRNIRSTRTTRLGGPGKEPPTDFSRFL